MIQDNTNYINNNTFVGSNADVNTIDKFDFNSFYRAYVVDINDPEKLGRVKIRIPALHEKSTTYPWAYPAALTGFGFQTGMFMLPPVGALVWVTFEYSDEHRPIYFGGIPTTYAEGKYQSYGPFINDGNKTLVTTDDLPIEYTGTQQIVYKSPKGSIIYFDSSDINNLIGIKNAYGQGINIAAIYDINTGELDRYTDLIFDDRNYFRLKENEVHLIVDGEEVDIGGGGGSGRAEWGHITGYLANQTDLKNALDLKANEADISRVGKTNNYNDLDNKPTIPTKTSQLTNDSNFATTSQLPTKTSQLTNDSGFITESDIPENVSAFNNDAGYITEDAIPENISAFNNDVGYITEEVDPTVPSWAKQSTKPTYTKSEVGLGNVDNKSSETIRSEITSENVTNALGYIPLNPNEKGLADGIATLDSNGKVPSSQLPAYVDDVVEGYYNSTDGKFYEDSSYTTEIPGEDSKIYISLDTNKTYRWSGTTFVTIASDLALGETHSTAYYGDLGKIAYDHSQSAHAPIDAQPNVIESISVNGTTQTVTNKNVDISVPTKTSDIINDSGFIDKTVNDLDNYYKKTETYNQTEVDNMFNTSGLFTLITEETYAETLEHGSGYYIMKDNGSIIFRSDITKTTSRYELIRTYPGDIVTIQEYDGEYNYLVVSAYPTFLEGHSQEHSHYNQDDNGLSLSMTYLIRNSEGNFEYLDSTVLESQMNHGMFDIRPESSSPLTRYTGRYMRNVSSFGVVTQDYEQKLYEEDYETLLKTITVPRGSFTLGNPIDVAIELKPYFLLITPELHVYQLHTNSTTLALVNEFDIAKFDDIPTKLSELENDKHFITSDNESIKNIIEISYADYKELEANHEIDPDTEYHITENGSTGSIEYEIRRIIQEMDEAKHPIGSLEFNTSGANPSTYLGFGTWELWGAGKVPIGVDSSDSSIDTADKTIGSKTASTTYTPAGKNTGTAVTMNAIELTHTGGAVQSHTLTATESGLPAHNHSGDTGTAKSSFIRQVGTVGTGHVQNHAPGYSGGSYIDVEDNTFCGANHYHSFTTNNNTAKNASSGHSHGFTQPSKHSFTPTTKTVTNPTFSGTQATITESTIQPSISCYMWKRTA